MTRLGVGFHAAGQTSHSPESSTGLGHCGMGRPCDRSRLRFSESDEAGGGGAIEAAGARIGEPARVGTDKASLAQRFESADRPGDVLRVLGPTSRPEIAERLVSQDKTVSLLVVPLDSSYVSPTAHKAIAWMQSRTEELRGQTPAVAGLELRWTGDSVIGRDYMAQVQASLDRAAAATVVLLLIVLLLVYRSLFLAMVPLATIGISLIIARGLLAWLSTAGWEISPLVELFLVAILFGTGTDFCLFISWRFAEHFNPENPAGVMKQTLNRSFMPLVTSAGTIIIGLMLMGTTKFKLFSTTGPSVALGLALSLIATLTLTPALLVLLARFRPQSFRKFAAPSSGTW